ncbi:5-formyltetrahydrofolate cyclo-ligase [Clostridium hydrogeniformans]|uniref:5-formyltetrahydrofolate cyclo-ligase n=1 Tax=Clostridium hydrogeniformans TaxID=349933 RepID=UPI00048663B4|nr:5-formyltetrahydrofolate cyclo-ligase [Clostridium hydrogeniformans]
MNSYKSTLRKNMIALRDGATIDSLKEASKNIFNKVISTEAYKNSKVIFIFVSFGSEVYTHELITYSLKLGKRICVPKVVSKKEGMKAIEIKSLEELTPSNYGILEPEIKESNIIDERSIDLVIIPGVAFDKDGGRLGYGGGFYDRFLPMVRKESYKIAIAYSFQVIEKVPREENDFLVPCIITD